MSYKARLLADWDPSSSLQVCAVTTGQYSFLWICLLLTAQQGSLAQQAVTPCHPDPAAGWNSWNSTTIYKMWNKWKSNLVTSLVQVPDKPTQIQPLETWWVLGINNQHPFSSTPLHLLTPRNSGRNTPTAWVHMHPSADQQQMLIQQLELEHSNPTPAIKHHWVRCYGVSPN